jgi:hypothetical protein
MTINLNDFFELNADLPEDSHHENVLQTIQTHRHLSLGFKGPSGRNGPIKPHHYQAFSFGPLDVIQSQPFKVPAASRTPLKSKSSSLDLVLPHKQLKGAQYHFSERLTDRIVGLGFYLCTTNSPKKQDSMA